MSFIMCNWLTAIHAYWPASEVHQCFSGTFVVIDPEVLQWCGRPNGQEMAKVLTVALGFADDNFLIWESVCRPCQNHSCEGEI